MRYRKTNNRGMKSKTTPHIRLQLAKRLKDLRKKKDLTQEQMAEKLEMDLRYYQRLESAKPNAVKIDTIDKLSKVLKISPSKLLDF